MAPKAVSGTRARAKVIKGSAVSDNPRDYKDKIAAMKPKRGGKPRGYKPPRGGKGGKPKGKPVKWSGAAIKHDIGRPPKGYRGMKPPKYTGPGGRKPGRKNRKLSEDLQLLEKKYKKSGAKERDVLKLEKSKGKRLKEKKSPYSRRFRGRTHGPESLKKRNFSSRSLRAAERASKHIKTKAEAMKFKKSDVFKRAKASADKIRGSSKFKRAAAAAKRKARSLRAGLERKRHSASKRATKRPTNSRKDTLILKAKMNAKLSTAKNPKDRKRISLALKKNLAIKRARRRPAKGRPARRRTTRRTNKRK